MRTLQVAKRDRLLFLHIPKTAGTSMRYYLRAQYRRDEIFPATNWNECASQGLDPADYALFAGHFRCNFRGVVPPGTRSMVILRDPVARYISHLRHAHAAQDFDRHHENIKNLTLADIIRHPQYGPLWTNGMTKWMAANAHPDAVAQFLAESPKGDPATLETCDVESQRLARAKRHVEEVDLVGFTEDIDRLADELCETMKFHPPSGFPVKNVGVNAALSDRISADDRVIIARLNEEDLELCAHAREMIEARRLRRTVLMLACRRQYDVPELPFALDLNKPMPGSGWHHAESAGSVVWRWTDAEMVTSIQFARSFPPDTTCTICFFDWAVPPHPKLSLAVNGALRAFSLGEREGQYQLRFTMSHDTDTDFYDVVLRILWPIPEKSALDDVRALGIAVSSIVFEPDHRSQQSSPSIV